MTNLKRIFVDLWPHEEWFWDRLGAPKWERTIPNTITLFRGRLALFGINAFYFAYVANPELKWFTLAMLGTFSVCWVLDLVDGAIAKAYDMRSDAGKYLDPACDALVVFYGFIPAVHHYGVPAWLVMPVGIISFCGGLIFWLRLDEKVETNLLAKVAMGFIYVGGVLLLASIVAESYAHLYFLVLFGSIGVGFLWIGCGLMIASTVMYYKDDLALIRELRLLPRAHWSSLL